MTQRGKKRGAASGFESFGAYQHKGGDGRNEREGRKKEINGVGKTPASVKAKTRVTG